MALERMDVSEERIASIIRRSRIGELGTMLAVTSNRSTLRRNFMRETRLPSFLSFFLFFSHIFLRGVLRLLVTANVVPSSPILVLLMIEAVRSSETSVLTTATLHNVPEDFILHSHRRENLKSYIALTGWAL
jgi:hypothetical protein